MSLYHCFGKFGLNDNTKLNLNKLETESKVENGMGIETIIQVKLLK